MSAWCAGLSVCLAISLSLSLSLSLSRSLSFSMSLCLPLSLFLGVRVATMWYALTYPSGITLLVLFGVPVHWKVRCLHQCSISGPVSVSGYGDRGNSLIRNCAPP